MKFKVNEITTIAIFAALWGALEITLGTLLHVLHLPFMGAFMAGIGAFILLIARSAVPRAGTTTLIGFITALIKLLSVGGSKLMPSAGIFMESILVDIALSAFGLNVFGYCLGASLATSITVLQNFIGVIFVLGKGVDYFINNIKYNFEKMGIAFKGIFSAFIFVITIKIILCVIFGIFIGMVAWKMTGRLACSRRL